MHQRAFAPEGLYVLSPGFQPHKRLLNEASPGRMAFVPEGQCDRSLARSAWEWPPQKTRPVGYGLIRAETRTDSTIGVISLP
jgi:hypothetical protein